MIESSLASRLSKRKQGRVAGMTLSAILGLGLTVLPASASNADDDTIWYRVDPTVACKQQYEGGTFGASLYNWSPDGIYCYGLSVPFGVTWVGSLDAGRIYWYCKDTYGETADAKVSPGWRFPMRAWFCVLPA